MRLQRRLGLEAHRRRQNQLEVEPGEQKLHPPKPPVQLVRQLRPQKRELEEPPQLQAQSLMLLEQEPVPILLLDFR